MDAERQHIRLAIATLLMAATFSRAERSLDVDAIARDALAAADALLRATPL